MDRQSDAPMLRAAETPLTGGNVADGVVHVGDTVRKPATAATPAVAALLDHLHGSGFEGAPRFHGLDDRGRQVLDFVPGTIAHALPPMDAPQLRRLGAFIRDLHDACATFAPEAGHVWEVPIPPDGDDLIVHHDLAPWNVVVDGDRFAVIDWDGAGPGTRMWDLAYSAIGFAVVAPDGDADVELARVASLLDGYGVDATDRARFPRLMADHARGMWTLLVDGARTGTQPWARLHDEGHADHWGGVAEHLDQLNPQWSDALVRSVPLSWGAAVPR